VLGVDPYRYNPFPPSVPLRNAVNGPRVVAAEAKYAELTEYRDGVKYDATYVVFAVTGTGEVNNACCQPLADSFVNVTCANRVPVFVHNDPTCVPVATLGL
jgi:hypothetical protein